MPNKETLTEEDQALVQMYKADTANSTLSPEEERAYLDLIDSQRSAHEASLHETKTPTGETDVHVAKPIGDTALRNPMAVHSKSWRELDN